MALFHDADVELELLLALLLPALEPAAEDLQEGGTSTEGGETGDDAVHEFAQMGGPRDLQAVAGVRERLTCITNLLGKRPARRRGRDGHQPSAEAMGRAPRRIALLARERQPLYASGLKCSPDEGCF